MRYLIVLGNFGSYEQRKTDFRVKCPKISVSRSYLRHILTINSRQEATFHLGRLWAVGARVQKGILRCLEVGLGACCGEAS